MHTHTVNQTSGQRSKQANKQTQAIKHTRLNHRETLTRTRTRTHQKAAVWHRCIAALCGSAANTASALAGLLWFGTDLPYRFMWRRLDTLTFDQKMLCCLLSNSNMGMGGRIIAQYESSGNAARPAERQHDHAAVSERIDSFVC